jgi:dihydroorotase
VSERGPEGARPGRVAYVNARLIDPASGLDAPGALLSDGRRIADLGPRLFADGVPEGTLTVECGGHCLAPGLIDMRAHLREPGAEHKETLATASRAAAAGGITSIACMPNTDPVIDQIALIEFIARRARETSLVKIYPVAAITRGLGGNELTEIGMLAEAGAVGFSDADRAVSDSRVMLRALTYAGRFGKLVMQHPEDHALTDGGLMNDGELATRLGLAGMPAEAEVILIERDLRLAERARAPYHVAHLSTAAAVAAVRRAKKRGLAVSCATAPHYFALNETAVDDYRTFAKVRPPLRGEADRAAVVDGLADGTIDAIVSDHAPHDQDSKRTTFAQAAFGMVGLETMLPLALELVHNGRLGLADLLAGMTATPARLLGLEQGRLAKGAPADLVLFDPERPWRIDTARLRSKSRNAPYDGRPVQGRVLRTVVGGACVFDLETDA